MTRHLETRRDALRAIAALGLAAPFALNLAQVGTAAAANGPSDYKALVCVFLRGGNDSNNLLLATDTDSWRRYWLARNRGVDPIALMPPGTPRVPVGQISTATNRRVLTTDNPEYWGGVLPIAPRTPQAIPGSNVTVQRDFALHPLLPQVRGLYNSNRLAFLANVGTLLAPITKTDYLKGSSSAIPIPQRLFSHSDQQAAWQSGQVESPVAGWGGKLVDAFVAAGNSASVDFASLTTADASIFPVGKSVKPYRAELTNTGAGAQAISLLQQTGGYNYSSIMLQALSDTLLQNDSPGSALGDAYVAAVRQSNKTAKQFNAALAKTTVSAPAVFTDPMTGLTAKNPLAEQLYAVADTIANHGSLGVNRQVFFVQLDGFDTHNFQNKRQGLLYAQIDHALYYFDRTMQMLGLANAVTTFTASDFNRTFSTNGDGTDHSWGGHHLIMGGAVKGGDIYGTYPTLGLDDKSAGFANPDAVGDALIPTTSVEQYLATMGLWLGVTDSQLATIFPRLSTFSAKSLGFMAD